MVVNDSKKVLKSAINYECDKCNYTTVYKTHFNKHLQTKKHKCRIMIANDSNLSKSANKWLCECGKSYKFDSGYYRHKKTCTYKKQESKEELTSLVFKLIDENKELRNQISELIPKVGNNNNNNNNNNKQFNINVFLNEKCKDAISMKDFLENITITMRDLDFTKENGNIKGITNIITNNLSKLSLYKRPLHCYDKNNKVLYIKNKEWEQDEDYKQINSIIASVETQLQLSTWTNENPDYMQSEAKQCEFIKIVNSTMVDNPETRDNIIKTLCEKVMIRAQAS
jgi:hypothetical protein